MLRLTDENKELADRNKEFEKEYVDVVKEKDDMIILDIGAPCSLVRREWLKKYIENNGIKIKDLEKLKIKKFRFGLDKVYESINVYKIPTLLEITHVRTL